MGYYDDHPKLKDYKGGKFPTVFKSTSGCGYGEYRYFIKMKNGNLLCINTYSDRISFDYKAGDVEFEPEHYCNDLKEVKDHNLEHSPLWGTFLFDHFLESEYGIKRKRVKK